MEKVFHKETLYICAVCIKRYKEKYAVILSQG